ncbi:hypothetical protein BrE312_3010 [Brenneria sp. EniD312]|nr:hypothetical protein BrE312_3010 [Brenneria sp. EniD312]
MALSAFKRMGVTPPQPSPSQGLSLIHKSKEPLEAMCILVLGSFLVLCFLLFVGVRNHAEVDAPANAPQGSGASQCRVGQKRRERF